MNEEKRNPYEPTKAPLFADQQPLPNANVDYEREYAGFWIRVGAIVVDGLILLPVTLLNAFGLQLSQRYFAYAIVPMMVVNALYWMYLVKRNGGTPGKRLLKLRITMADYSPVTMGAAVIRNAPLFLFSVVASISQMLAAQKISESDYKSLGFLERSQLMATLSPSWNRYSLIFVWVWMIVGIIVLLSNQRRRALHDFMAGTVVLRE
jgi:uncharacterized RDD family membrane protein YckC